jgi:membrane-associated phospholipid phosphatase
MLGGFGPMILFFFSLYLLRDKRNLFFYYVVGIFCNLILNFLLKGIIQQPRPEEYLKQFNTAITNGKRIIFKDGRIYDLFGMPSGHSQGVLFSTLFIYLSLKNRNILFFYLFISLITMFQRVYFNYHSTFQVFVGAICGAIFGFIFYFLAKENIVGKITEKIDDYGPL